MIHFLKLVLGGAVSGLVGYFFGMYFGIISLIVVNIMLRTT